MNCVIIDDEPMAIEVIERYIAKMPELRLLQVFREPVESLGFLQTHPVDCLFLDINMPGIGGLQLLKTLEHPPPVIYTTAYAEYAAESYELNAIDYLIKPITFERFLTAVNKLQARNKENGNAQLDEFINLKSGSQLHRVKLSEVLFLEKNGNYLTVHTVKRKIVIRQNMNDIFSMLPAKRFIRVHKSFVVAKNRIDIFDTQQIVIQEHKIPVGPMYKDQVLAMLNQQ